MSTQKNTQRFAGSEVTLPCSPPPIKHSPHMSANAKPHTHTPTHSLDGNGARAHDVVQQSYADTPLPAKNVHALAKHLTQKLLSRAVRYNKPKDHIRPDKKKKGGPFSAELCQNCESAASAGTNFYIHCVSYTGLRMRTKRISGMRSACSVNRSCPAPCTM